QRVVHRAGNALFLQPALHFVAVLQPHRVLRPDAVAAFAHRHRRGGEAGVGDALRVARAELVAALQLPVEAFQLGQQHRRLQGVEPAADADPRVAVARALAVHADLARRLRQRIVVGEEGAAVAVAAQRLAREEAGRTPGAQAAAAPSPVAGAETLRAVFDH